MLRQVSGELALPPLPSAQIWNSRARDKARYEQAGSEETSRWWSASYVGGHCAGDDLWEWSSTRPQGGIEVTGFQSLEPNACEWCSVLFREDYIWLSLIECVLWASLKIRVQFSFNVCCRPASWVRTWHVEGGFYPFITTSIRPGCRWHSVAK